MPHFYFHIRDGEKVIPDEDGLDLEDLAAAENRARADAVSMLGDALAEGADISHQVIEISDSGGLILAGVALSERRDGDVPEP